jgi:hypothetical protein
MQTERQGWVRCPKLGIFLELHPLEMAIDPVNLMFEPIQEWFSYPNISVVVKNMAFSMDPLLG